MELLDPKAVIFDLGSTLIEYEKIPWDELNKECALSAHDFMTRKGIEIPARDEFHVLFEELKEEFRARASRTFEEWSVPQIATTLFKTLGVDDDGSLAETFFDAYYEPVENHIYAYDDAVDTLDAIKTRYGKIGLISNTVFPERAHRAELKRFGLDRFLDFAIFSSTFGLRKPHEDIFYKAANLAGVAPSEGVYIGDRYLEDVQGPNGIGMAAVLKVKEGREYPDDMPETVRKVHTLSELSKHFEF